MKPLFGIVARAHRNAIGLRGDLPWRIAEDLRYFKSKTMGGAMVMGRKTFDSFPKPLPGRLHVVLTRDMERTSSFENVVFESNPLEAVHRARNFGTPWVIGGAVVFERFLPLITRMYVTEIDRLVEADTFLPPLSGFRELMSSRSAAHSDVRYSVLERSLQNCVE